MRDVPASSIRARSKYQSVNPTAQPADQRRGSIEREQPAGKPVNRAVSVVTALSHVVAYLFYTILFVLPLDVYYTLAGHSSGVFLSQVLTGETCALLLITLALARWTHVRIPLQITWRDALPLGIVLVSGIASAIGSDFRGTAFKDVLKIAMYLGIYVVARAVRALPGSRMRAMLVLLAGFGVVVVAGLLGSLSGFPDLVGLLLNIKRTVALLPHSTVMRSSATFRYPNELAAYLVVMLMLLLACAMSIGERVLQVCYVVLILAGSWLLLLTYTRGALIAVLVVVPALLIITGKKKIAFIGLLAGVVILGVLIVQGGATSHRILSVFSADDRGYSTRGSAWHWAITLFLHHPIVGAGVGTIQFQPGAPYTDPIRHVKEIDAENLYLNVLAEMGVFGFIAVMAAFVGALRRAWRYMQSGGDVWDRSWNVGVFGGLAAILVYGFVDPVLVSGQVTGLICALVGLVGVSASTSTRSPSLEPFASSSSFADDDALSSPAIDLPAPSGLPPGLTAPSLTSRIVFLLNSTGMGGAQVVSIHLASELQRQGANVLVVCPPAASALIGQIEANQLPYRPLDMGISVGRWRGWLGTLLFFLPFTASRFNRLVTDLAAESPSVFVAPFLREQLLLARLRATHGVSAIWVLHSPLHYLPHRLLLRRLQKQLARKASAIIAISRSQATEWVQAGMPSSNVYVVRNGIPDTFFAPLDPSRSHPVSGSAYQIGFVSRLSEGKGAQFLIQALPSILQRHPNTMISIAGTGRYEQQLRRLVKALDLDAHVQFLGFVADVPQLLKTLDLVVLPTVDKGEVLPTILLEASAAGIPVIASDLPGIREEVLPGETGLLITPGDTNELADAIMRVIADPALALSMGERGQAHVHSQFALSNTAAQFLQVLHELELQSGQHSGVLQNTSMYVRAVHRARFMSQSALFLLSKVLTAAATAIWTILSASVLTQTAYGNLMLGMGMLDIFAAVNDAGITTLATREAAQAKQSELPALTGSVLLIKLMLGICSTLLVLGIAALTPFSAQAKQLITLLAPSLIFSAMLSLSLLFRARSLLWQIVAVTCGVSVTSIALTIFATTHNSSVTTFALIELGTTVLSGILMVLLVGVQFKPRLRPDLRRMRQLAISAIPYGVSLTLVYLYYRIDVPLLAVLGGANEVAVYTSAYRILDVITLLPAAASGIALAEMAKLAKEPDRKYLVTFSQQYLELALVIGLLIVVCLTLTGRLILKLLYQGRYDSSYSALSVLAWAGAVSLVTNVFLPLVNALGRRRVLISASLIALGANVAINIFLIPSLGALGAAIATLCTELVVTISYAYVTIRELQWRLKWRVILSAALATIIALGTQQLFTSLRVPGWLVVVVSLSLWVAVLAVLVPRWIRDLIQTRGNLSRRSGNTTPVSERQRELAQMEANHIQ